MNGPSRLFQYVHTPAATIRRRKRAGWTESLRSGAAACRARTRADLIAVNRISSLRKDAGQNERSGRETPTQAWHRR
jgi:hypothetical protein